MRRPGGVAGGRHVARLSLYHAGRLGRPKLVPLDVYDAAAIDGAGRWKRLRTITWPLLLPLLAPAIIIRGIFTFNQFYLFYVMDPPWPLTTLATLVLRLRWRGPVRRVGYHQPLFRVLVLFLLWFDRRSRAGEGVTYA